MSAIEHHIKRRSSRARINGQLADILRHAKRNDKSEQIQAANSAIKRETSSVIEARAYLTIESGAAGLRLAGKLADDNTVWELEEVGSDVIKLSSELEVEK